MSEKTITPWDVSQIQTDQYEIIDSKINNKIKDGRRLSSGNKLQEKNHQQMRLKSKQIKRQIIKRSKSATLRVRNQQIIDRVNIIENNRIDFKLHVQKLQSLQCLPLTQKPLQIRSKKYEQRQSSIKRNILIKNNSQKRYMSINYNNVNYINKRSNRQQIILINQKIKDLLKTTQNKLNNKISTKVNGIIKGYVSIYTPQTINDLKNYRQKYVRQLLNYKN